MDLVKKKKTVVIYDITQSNKNMTGVSKKKHDWSIYSTKKPWTNPLDRGLEKLKIVLGKNQIEKIGEIREY
jgi:hypothetical protein